MRLPRILVLIICYLAQTTPLATGKDVGLTSAPTTFKTTASIKSALDSAAAAQRAIYATYGAEGAEVRR